MDERPYLSIGDVLALLQREFPDVTISKIRFLESRGLLVPDRTPSGYRKFYEHDVERLRWILRQQREHFLPLKVIKGRLEGQEPTEPAALFEMAEPPAAGGSGPDVPAHRPGHDEAADEAASAAATGATEADAGIRSGGGRLARAGALHNGLERAPGNGLLSSVPARGVSSGALPEASRQQQAASEGRWSSATSASSGAAPLQATGAHKAEAPEARPQIREPQHAGHPQPSGARAQVPEASIDPADQGRRPDEQAGKVPVSAPQPKDAEPQAGAGRSEAASPSSGPSNELGALVGVSLTRDELSQASGLDAAQVAELEEYGLIDGRTMAGVRTYDESALVVAGLCASFARFGVEARHLRVFKYAAERQTGLYSQIVLPLLRQRNPDARRRALEDVARLSELGASLQACFAKAALRDLTGA